jgi:hypothetical protein
LYGFVHVEIEFGEFLVVLLPDKIWQAPGWKPESMVPEDRFSDEIE